MNSESKNPVSTKIEFYKILKEEYRFYLNVVASLWRMKFLAIGAIITTAIAHNQIFEAGKNDHSVAVGILLLPLLALFIDILILGVAFQLRNISTFIEKEFDDTPLIRDWEILNWKDGNFVQIRSWITILSTLGITLILYLAAFVMTLVFLNLELRPKFVFIVSFFGFVIPIIIMCTMYYMKHKLYKNPNS